MFAPRVARGQKAVASSTGKQALQHSTLAEQRFAGSAVEQAHVRQGSIGNQATLRLLAQRGFSPAGKEAGGDHGQEAEPGNMSALGTTPGISWNFSKIPIFPPDRVRWSSERPLQPSAPDGSEHRFVHDFSRIRVDAPVSDRVRAPTEKAVDGDPETRIGLIVEKNGPDAGAPPAPDAGAPPAAPPVKVKKAGVGSFTVDWSKNAASSSTKPSFRLDYNARFKNDVDHDPALAEFRQNAMTSYEVTAGPNKGSKGGTAPLHDDHYARADDTAGHTLNDVDFVSNDNPGLGPIDKDDVITYSFTAEQMIIDTSDGNKVIAKRGPHTATATGKDPRTFAGVPVKLA